MDRAFERLCLNTDSACEIAKHSFEFVADVWWNEFSILGGFFLEAFSQTRHRSQVDKTERVNEYPTHRLLPCLQLRPIIQLEAAAVQA